MKKLIFSCILITFFLLGCGEHKTNESGSKDKEPDKSGRLSKAVDVKTPFEKSEVKEKTYEEKLDEVCYFSESAGVVYIACTGNDFVNALSRFREKNFKYDIVQIIPQTELWHEENPASYTAGYMILLEVRGSHTKLF
jgi:hypothetical protein